VHVQGQRIAEVSRQCLSHTHTFIVCVSSTFRLYRNLLDGWNALSAADHLNGKSARVSCKSTAVAEGGATNSLSSNP
jgi:hypothetical protein